ncbi:MAG: 2-C-methyl-D-erythritol 2,4-cyclodiphosphate synthase [Ignavibacterium sp.]|nr:2-C-methyl-D-erythritol 2,4-cyclodiphosphate synthase [Ignavibacterium sp.]MDW8374985.1 2-C-methyl-D-erythritol 2,4-cyclodiphosphate synthase [Ignavibacteriales bacterium]
MTKNFPFRIGFGFDVHSFAENRKLIIGGVEIPYHKGLAGHSDADVLLHAISDALLGSLSLGDIGYHFPNADPKWKDVDSKIILKKSYELVIQRGYKISNIDSMLAAEAPKIAPYIEQMKKRISDILDISENQISIKATTTEKLGFIGRSEGVAAIANVLVYKD